MLLVYHRKDRGYKKDLRNTIAYRDAFSFTFAAVLGGNENINFSRIIQFVSSLKVCDLIRL